MDRRLSGKTIISTCYRLNLYQIPLYRDMQPDKEYPRVIRKRNNAAFFYITPVNATQVKIRLVIGEAIYRQTINLLYGQVGYGARRYFKCDCGKAVASLYFKDKVFACRHCHNLLYDIKHFYFTGLGYRLNRQEKIRELRGKIMRPIRRGGYSKRANKLMALIAKVSVR